MRTKACVGVVGRRPGVGRGPSTLGTAGASAGIGSIPGLRTAAELTLMVMLPLLVAAWHAA